MKYGPFSKQILLGFLCFAAGGALSFLVLNWTGINRGQLFSQVETRESGYHFISPLLECDSTESVSNSAYNFNNTIENKVKELKASGTVTDMAVYYRDLDNGPWFGVNVLNQFLPASLLKVPASMALYKLSESDPAILDKKFFFKEKAASLANVKQLIPPPQEIQPGKEYTVRELIDAAIKNSDNQAVNLLYLNMPPNTLEDIYQRLGVPDDVLHQGDATLSAKQYATFFRILFNSSYLNREDSEKFLELLSQTKFSDGLVAGVPANITVAHKFGESGTAETHQLHDCGIVYYPKKPYLLCVMSKGSNLDGLKNAIKTISETVYNGVAKLKQ